jgi:polyisoprenoid-binding protein YceI
MVATPRAHRKTFRRSGLESGHPPALVAGHVEIRMQTQSRPSNAGVLRAPWPAGRAKPAFVLACALIALPASAVAQSGQVPSGQAPTQMPPARAQAGSAGAQTYRLDPVHTRVLFAVSHAGYSHALGTVSGSTGTLAFDPDDWSSAKVSVSVPMTRIDLGDAGWNRAAGGQGLLDVNAYPVATFVSRQVKPVDRNHASVCGMLTLHGVARDTCLQVTFNQLQRLPLPPFHRVAGFSATATLSRKAFGMDAWPTMVGDEVQLRIEAEAMRDSSIARDPAPGAIDTTPADTTPANSAPAHTTPANSAQAPATTP